MLKSFSGFGFGLDTVLSFSNFGLSFMFVSTSKSDLTFSLFIIFGFGLSFGLIISVLIVSTFFLTSKISFSLITTFFVSLTSKFGVCFISKTG